MMRLRNLTQNLVLAETVEEATSFFARSRGLLGQPSWPQEKALWIRPCSSIHTFFMAFAIDAVFVDKSLKVKAIYRHLGAWRMTLPAWGAHSVFELNAGRLEGRVQVGDQLNVGD